MRLTEMLLLSTDPRSAASLLADPAFVARCVRASGATPDEVDVAGAAPGAFRIRTRRGLTSDQVPAPLRAFARGRLEITQVEEWGAPDSDGDRAGTVAVDVTGTPVRLRGTVTLVAHGPGTSALRYAGDLHAGVPVFAEVVERAVAEAVRTALSATAEVAELTLRPGSRPGPHSA
ncbi:DUF2505 family protein [Cellulomonas sp. DKR-3]|uniref:DUF2505 family protein n=1 Tax=Cellulomonas fulva TaxID=2835530 RepID=A0ABS5TZI2_9CELL|nr:DUF2505 domain-containing protein [Cellulomonas fulva]MBT0994568.1 DUF2505 family protein [Cellulomonas fulva]